jgi:CRISPR/Cas system CSM-associated protein Csm3 (group 7 of RAMP superfamily)
MALNINNMTKINYKIKFLSDWHIGSGLGAGAETDAEIIKSSDGLPYIPGKTIKGLLKNACHDIADINESKISKEIINQIFGKDADKTDKSEAGSAFFGNATICIDESKEIIQNGLQEYLFKNISSTAIDENTRIASPKSLRSMEVCMPITLNGSIEIDQKHIEAITLACKWVRHIGVNRNRGLGRCTIAII